MRILALDPSETSCGFAVWGPQDAVAASGVWVLGSSFTSAGTVFARLHERMSELNTLGSIDAVFFERPRHLDAWTQQSNANSHLLMVGLAAHIMSWGEAMGCRIIRDVNMATWRRHFLGKMPRATKSEELKDLAMERARQLGFKPMKHDQAEAIGILDYACEQLGTVPPWRAQEVLRPPLGRVA